MPKSTNKFKFTQEYQWDLLRYTVQDKNGIKALNKFDDDYFTLINHQVLAYALKKYHKQFRRLASETMLRESLVSILNSKEFISLVTKDEQKDIISLVKPLYSKPVKEGDRIYELCKSFRNYVRLKKTLEHVDINNYDSYIKFAKQVQTSITDEDDKDEAEAAFLLRDIRNRQFRRQENQTTFPTPFKQINAITNAGGYEKGSIIVLLDKQKRGKTMALVNVGRGYLKMRKKVLVIDLENGQENYFSRLEQSIMGISKMDIQQGDYDNRVQKRFRKYARLGGEIIVERMPALVTTCDDIQTRMDYYYREYGIQFEELIIDYAAKMGCRSNTDNDTSRISQVYLEMGNLALKNDIEHVWTANHVTREAATKRMKTRYAGEDIALCIDIVRHSHAIYGLNRSDEEMEAGFFRMELVEQRDGFPSGRAVFSADMGTQRADELSSSARKEYDEDFYSRISSEDDDGTETVSKHKKNKRKNDFSD